MKKTARCEPKGIVSTTAEKNLKALRAAVIERIGNTFPKSANIYIDIFGDFGTCVTYAFNNGCT